MARSPYHSHDFFNEVYYSAGSYQRDDEGNFLGFLDEFGRTRAQLLEGYVTRANELDSIGSVYQTADKIITGEDISVTVVNDKEMNTPATNNGREIIYNANLIEDLNAETITSLHGTNYHEVAHILFSPRAGSNLGQFVKDNKVTRAYNMLEEARIEQMMIAKYPSTRLFLEATAMDYALKGDPSEWADMFPVITGRKYLDIDLRQAVADKFISKYGVEVASVISDIVHSYRGLVFPDDFDKAKELITRFAELVGTDTERPRKSPEGGCGGGTPRPVLTKGRPANGKDQAKLQEKAEKQDNSPSENLQAGLTSGGSNDQFNETENKYTQDDEAVANKINERMKEIRNNEAVKREVNETRKAIKGDDDIRSVIKPSQYDERQPEATAITYARKFGQELERMVRDNDPAWNTHLPSGKLNISRTMNPDVNSISEMFDVWDTGNDNTDIEAVMLLDHSGSMGGYMRDVCQNAWVIKRGIESINGSVSVYAFDDKSSELYNKLDNAKPRSFRHIFARGSTDPLRGLMEAERVLEASTKSIKILFAVTDGQWSNTEECDEVIKRLNAKGILTCVVFMSDYQQYKSWVEGSLATDDSGSYYRRMLAELRHGAQIFRAIAKPRDVLEVATDLVKSTLARKEH